jgi:drug/metabolite transporter (DMT)-like permease
MLLVGMISWVLYSVVINQLHKIYNDIEITALTCYAGAIVNIPFFVLKLGGALDNKLHAILITCIMGALLLMAFYCYSYGMRKEPRFCIFSQYLEPIFGLIAASFFIRSAVTIPQIVAVFFIIAGTIIISINTKPV